ncbi:BTB/POZ domain-containing protein [Hibiscus syriacus]|uniref:BTB/POZ domain-containing protein n=1 Tax=Hibiscus syriacus TaxID=106335 RepID=A0A6A2WAN1_HIBSY|nr:BTB/POZ domain-containing protein [Hibiscus syriacus]
MFFLPCRLYSGQILEALHVYPASGVSLDKEKSSEVSKPTVSGLPTLAKLTKASASGGPSKQGPVEKKETPQERLKKIMNRQLNKQIKKDTAAEMDKKREQECQRLEKLAETSRLSCQRNRSRSRSYSRSPPRLYLEVFLSLCFIHMADEYFLQYNNVSLQTNQRQ